MSDTDHFGGHDQRLGTRPARAVQAVGHSHTNVQAAAPVAVHHHVHFCNGLTVQGQRRVARRHELRRDDGDHADAVHRVRGAVGRRHVVGHRQHDASEAPATHGEQVEQPSPVALSLAARVVRENRADASGHCIVGLSAER